MADVTGDIGGQSVQLNNAATETTLKQLLAATLALNAASGKGGKQAKLQAELEKELKRLADQSKKYLKAQEELTEAAKAEAKAKADAAKAEAEKKKKLDASAEALGALYGATEKAALGMTNLLSTMANLGNSMTSAAQSLNAIPVVGGVLSGVFGAVAGAAEKTYKSFQQAAEVGASFGGSITDMINAATGAGLTIDQFTGIIAKSGDSLALLGGSTTAGAKRLAELGKGIRDSDLGNELARMGFTTESINSGLATYSGMLAKTGALQGMNNRQLIESTGNYLKNLDAVSRLTGQSKKELEDARQQRMKDAQFRMIMSKMDAASQENLQMLMDTIPEEHREGMKEIIATGTATSEAGRAAMAFLPESARNMMSLNQQIRTTGKVGADQARNLSVAYQRETKAFSQSGLAETLANFGDQTQQNMALGAMNVAARTGDINKTFAEQQKEAEERKRKEEQLKKEGLDPASMKAYQEQIAAVSNQFTKLLASSGLLEGMMSIFQGLVGFISTVVVPVFKFVGDNALIAGIVLGTLGTIVGVTNAILAFRNFQEKLVAAGMMKMLLPLGALTKAMFVAALPILKVVAPILLLAAGVALLVKYWDDITDGFLRLLNIITFGKAGISKEEAERRRQEREQKRLLEEKNKTTEKSIDLQEKENEEKEKGTSSQPGYNFASPQALFDSAAQRAGRAATAPGASAAAPSTGLGSLAARYESGNRGSSAVGWDSTGGTSYGKYQIATRTGTMDKFMEFLKTSNPQAYERLKAAGPADAGKDGAFAKEWQKLAAEGGLGTSEHDFIKKTHFDVGMKGVKNASLEQMIANSPALKEVMWSTSVQHGGGGASAIFNRAFKPGMSEADLIKAVYAERATKFGSSTAQVQASVQKRFIDEQGRALAMIGQPSGGAAPSQTQVAAATDPRADPRAGRGTNQPATTVATASTGTPGTSGAGAPGAGGVASLNDVVTSLQTLNMQMGQLIALNRSVADLNQKQLSVQRGLSGDMMAMGA